MRKLKVRGACGVDCLVLLFLAVLTPYQTRAQSVVVGGGTIGTGGVTIGTGGGTIGTGGGTIGTGGGTIGTGVTVGTTAREATVSCDQYNDVMRIRFALVEHDEDIQGIFVFSDNACGITLNPNCPVGGTGLTTDPYLVVVDMDAGTQVSPTYPAEDCGVQYDGTQWTFSILSKLNSVVPDVQDPGYIVDYTMVCHQISCNPTNINDFTTFGSGTSNAVDLTLNDLVQDVIFSVPNAVPRVELHIMNADSDPFVPGQPVDTPLLQAYIGQYAYLAMYFWRGMFPTGRDTAGKTFIWSYPEIESDGFNSVTDFRLLVTTTTSVGTDFTITSPLIGATQTHTVSKADPLEISLTLNNNQYTSGFKIESEEDISVVAIARKTNSAGAFTVPPVDTLHYQYYYVSLNAVNAELLIVGTVDGTFGDIQLPVMPGLAVFANGQTYGSGQVIPFSLNELGTFYINTMNMDISGAVISADEPIAVIAGNSLDDGTGEKDHLLSPIPPKVSLGKKHVYFGLPGTNGKPTTYKIVSTNPSQLFDYNPDETSNTVHTFAAGGETFQTTLSPGEFRVLESDEPVMVTQFTPNADLNDFTDDFDPTMTFVPPVEQWSSTYYFGTTDTFNIDNSLIIVALEGQQFGVYLDETPLFLTWYDVKGPPGLNYKWCKVDQATGLTDGAHLLQSSEPNELFMAMLYGTRSDTEFLAYSHVLPGTRMVFLSYFIPCTNQLGTDGDLVDNDCDELMDEEIRNGLDDDGDGLVDEDNAVLWDEDLYAVAARPINCYASAFSTFTPGPYTRQITMDDGCRNPALANNKAFYLENGNFYRVPNFDSEPILTRTPEFRMARFDQSNLVYFGCNFELCYSSADLKCRHLICESGVTGVGRRKREGGQNITTIFGSTAISIGIRENENTVSQQTEPETSDCLTEPSYIIVVVVITLILLTVLIVAIFLLKRLKNYD